jgi:hypothetical protein
LRDAIEWPYSLTANRQKDMDRARRPRAATPSDDRERRRRATTPSDTGPLQKEPAPLGHGELRGENAPSQAPVPVFNHRMAPSCRDRDEMQNADDRNVAMGAVVTARGRSAGRTTGTIRAVDMSRAAIWQRQTPSVA